jgi:hypothetical protein
MQRRSGKEREKKTWTTIIVVSQPFGPLQHIASCRSVRVVTIYLYFDVQGFVSGRGLSPLPFPLFFASRIINESSREVASSPRTSSSHDTSENLPISVLVLAKQAGRQFDVVIFPIVRAFQIGAQSRRSRLRVFGCCCYGCS